jgi:hypothetical protein
MVSQAIGFVLGDPGGSIKAAGAVGLRPKPQTPAGVLGDGGDRITCQAIRSGLRLPGRTVEIAYPGVRAEPHIPIWVAGGGVNQIIGKAVGSGI